MPLPGLNTAFAAVTNLLGVRLDPFHSFNFLVEVQGILVGGFSACSGLQVQTETITYREGGRNDYLHQFAGPTTYPPLVLKHGLTLLNHVGGLWAWHQEVVQETIVRRSGTIYLLDKTRIPVMWWDFKNALPTKWTGPELSADSNTVAIESLELVHQGLSQPGIASALAGLGAQLSASFDVGVSF
jgi:phage tail-like protein